jgi:hypothetical protein
MNPDEFVFFWSIFRYKPIYLDPYDKNSKQTTVEKFFLQRETPLKTEQIIRDNYLHQGFYANLTHFPLEYQGQLGSFLLCYRNYNQVDGYENEFFYDNESLVQYLNSRIDQQLHEEKERIISKKQTTQYFQEQGLSHLLHPDTQLQDDNLEDCSGSTKSPSPPKSSSSSAQTFSEVHQQQQNQKGTILSGRAISTGPLEKIVENTRESSPKPINPSITSNNNNIRSSSNNNKTRVVQFISPSPSEQRTNTSTNNNNKNMTESFTISDPLRIYDNGNALPHQRIDQEIRSARVPHGALIEVTWSFSGETLVWNGQIRYSNVNGARVLVAVWMPNNPRYHDVFPSHDRTKHIIVPFPVNNVTYYDVKVFGEEAIESVSDLALHSDPNARRGGSQPPVASRSGSKARASVRFDGANNNNTSNNNNSSSTNQQAPLQGSAAAAISNSINSLRNATPGSSSRSQPNRDDDDDDSAPSGPSSAVALMSYNVPANFGSGSQKQTSVISIPLLGQRISWIDENRIPELGSIVRNNGYNKLQIVGAIEYWLIDLGVSRDFGITSASFQEWRQSLATNLDGWGNLDYPGQLHHPAALGFFKNTLLLMKNMFFQIKNSELKRSGQRLDLHKFNAQFSYEHLSIFEAAAGNAIVKNNNNNFNSRRDGAYGGGGGYRSSSRNRSSSNRASRPRGCPLNKCWECFKEHGIEHLDKVLEYTKEKGCARHGKKSSGNGRAAVRA